MSVAMEGVRLCESTGAEVCLPFSRQGFADLPLPEDARLGRILLDIGWVSEADLQRALGAQAPERKLGDVLVDMGLLTKQQVAAALSAQKSLGARLGEILVRKGLLSRVQLARALKVQAEMRRRLGEILVAMGAITRRQLDYALRIQKTLRLLFASVALASVVGCASVSAPADMQGHVVPSTPFDMKYRHVEKLLKRAQAFRYIPDARGQDHWQMPDETETRGGGDCEDMAIWLYTKLLASGVDEARLCIGRKHASDHEMHCWVMWPAGGAYYVLDPTTRRGVMRTEDLPSESYRPVYSYNKNQKFAHAATAASLSMNVALGG
ncbi:MAG TPA: hypothetical protein P5137_00095 [Candidatus Brocadiia bacterium]|nr:hypothetical protein [Candidatus Brocadiia bacterium]